MANHSSQRLPYELGTVVKWDDTSYWVFHYTSCVLIGEDYTQPGKECAECTTCKKNQRHMDLQRFTKMKAYLTNGNGVVWNAVNQMYESPHL